MTQILVVTDDHHQDNSVVYRERLAPSDFESDHFSGQLAERLGWAVDDAKQIERQQELSATRPSRPAVTLQELDREERPAEVEPAPMILGVGAL